MDDPRLIYVEKIIEAPAADVFRVLDDLDRYPDWNPFTTRVITDRVIGGQVELHVNMPGSGLRVQRERFTGYVPGERLSWGLRWGGGVLLDCDRVQQVEAQPDGTTRYVTYERFNGLLGGLVVHLYGAAVRRGFEQCADALALRVKTLRAT